MIPALAAISMAVALSGPPERDDAAPGLMVFPTAVQLDNAHDSQSLVVIERGPDGVTRDVTSVAVVTAADTSLVAVAGSVVRGLADGETLLTITHADQSVTVPVRSANASDSPASSFRLDVMPVLTSAGCNTGSCHGSARGQDGFHLSLFGYDPEGDYQALTRELPGRRIDLAFPETSLVIQKATGAVPHTGGELFSVEDDRYRTLLRWIEEGARRDRDDVASVTAIELNPPSVVVEGAGAEIDLVVRATYSDGTDRDVTDLAVVRTNNEVSMSVAGPGLVRSGEPGEAFITANFDTFTVGMPCIVLEAGREFEYADPAETVAPAGYIDGHIEHKLRDLRIGPSDLCTDQQFIRRVSLDIAGVLPTPEELDRFVADSDPRKRARAIDELLARKEFAEIWVMQWAELLQIRSNDRISEKAALLYFEWLRNAIASDMPVDEMIRRILTATGGTFAVPPTNFYESQNDTLVLAENAAQAFLGIRIQCAQCHNHPFDRWTQDDYYGFAAFFSQIGRKNAEDPRETVIFNSGNGEVRHPVGNRVVTPKFLGGEIPDVRGRDRRELLAGWMTSPGNPQFARSLANRVWAHFMGRGIVEPVDDFRVSNPPANGPLLDALAARLIEYDYDFKALVRDICNSRAYQRSTEPSPTNAADDRNFARAAQRRLRAEVLLDTICQVTEVPEKFKGLPLGERAVRIADGSTSNYFLTTFGRSSRESVAACEVSLEPSLSQALHLLNGDTVSAKVGNSPVVPRLLQEGDPALVVTELYRRCLSRSPTAVELDAALAEIGDSEPEPVLQDLFWAILNSQEFVFNH